MVEILRIMSSYPERGFKYKFVLYALIGFITTSSRFSHSQKSVENPVIKIENHCSGWSPEEFDQFIEEEIINKFKNPSLTLPYRDSPAGLYSQVKNLKTQCRVRIKQLRLSECFVRLEGFFGQFYRGSQENYMFSNIMTNDEYYASQPEKLMKLPKAFKDSAHGLPANWEEVAKENGWEWVYFHSKTNGQRRLVMIINNNHYDQRLLYFANNHDNDSRVFSGIQMQVIEKSAQGSKPKVHFRSWNFRKSDGLPTLAHNGGRCIQCHPNGPRAVVPIPPEQASFPMKISSGLSLSEFNKMLIVEENVDLSAHYNYEFFPLKLEIGERGKCINCHDNSSRNSLHFGLSRFGLISYHQFKRKVLKEKSMPPRMARQITQSERNEIVKSLKDEYRDKVGDWLVEPSCVKENLDNR